MPTKATDLRGALGGEWRWKILDADAVRGRQVFVRGVPSIAPVSTPTPVISSSVPRSSTWGGVYVDSRSLSVIPHSFLGRRVASRIITGRQSQ